MVELPHAVSFRGMADEALNRATKFAGRTGKIATLPDLIEWRLGKGDNSLALSQWYTPLSALYFALNGDRIHLIVVHGPIGPLANRESLSQFYSWEKHQQGGFEKALPVDLQDIFKLLESRDPNVHKFRVDTLWRDKDEFRFSLRDIANNLIVQAILGPKWKRYGGHIIQRKLQDGQRPQENERLEDMPILILENPFGSRWRMRRGGPSTFGCLLELSANEKSRIGLTSRISFHGDGSKQFNFLSTLDCSPIGKVVEHDDGSRLRDLQQKEQSLADQRRHETELREVILKRFIEA